MDDQDCSLLDYMKRYAAEALSSCEPKNDPTPMLAWRDGKDRYGILLIPSDFDDDEFVKRLVNQIIVVLIVNGACEAVWATAAWQLKAKTRDELPAKFADHPDRVEVMQLMHANPVGDVSGYVGEIIRVEGKPPMFAGWQDPDPEDALVAGRYPDALRRGMAGAASMPDDLRVFLESQSPEFAMRTVFSMINDMYEKGLL